MKDTPMTTPTETPEVDFLAARFTEGEVEHPHAMAFCEKARED